jgi:hypothetical protein
MKRGSPHDELLNASINGPGFHVFPSACSFTRVQVTNFSKTVIADATDIFNGHDDGKRRQLAELGGSPVMVKAADVLRQLVPGREPTDGVGLVSDPGCAEQPPHVDVEMYGLQGQVKRAGDDGVAGGYPLGAIIAVQNGTKFVAWVGAIDFQGSKTYHPVTLVLNAGDVLIFRIDLVHAGAAYDEVNVRIHFFLDRAGIVRQPDQTSLMCHHKNLIKNQ